jgi:hypothetical protein
LKKQRQIRKNKTEYKYLKKTLGQFVGRTGQLWAICGQNCPDLGKLLKNRANLPTEEN